jgi:predicted flavoprotein YhiN
MSKPELSIDLKPAHEESALIRKLGVCRKNFLGEARSRWRLDDAAFALLQTQCGAGGDFADAASAARAAKACRVGLRGPRPMAEAISSAGGVQWSELDDSLMVRRLPGVFVAGEMIDWDAPTGGYLMQGCFATGTRAGKGAAGIGDRRSEMGDGRSGVISNR